MPGLDSLTKFTNDITQLGNEPDFRNQQGSTMPEVNIPADLPIEDDSYDFEFGLPTEEPLDKPADTLLQSTNNEGSDDLPDIDENLSDIETDLPDIDENLLDIETDLPDIDENLSDIETDLPDIDENLSDIETDLSDIDENLSDIETDLSDIDTNLPTDGSTVETDPLMEEASLRTEDITSDDFATDAEGLSLDSTFSELSEGFNTPASQIDFSELEEAAQDFILDTDDVTDLPGENTVEDENLQSGEFDDNNFEITGFSDVDVANSTIQKKLEKDTDQSQRTDLTEEEYRLFKTNLETYPLNLRIAVEQLIVKNEFTDAVVMEVLFKVIKKVSARQLASHLEKKMDISITVPLNYERRTVGQYEEHKSSLEYALKNRIIPGAIAVLVVCAILYVLVYLVATFIYRPIKAEMLYTEGYTLIENDLYAQSELKFNEALTYSVKKKWFFTYAQAYREKRQYDRARNMYDQLARRFDYDKKAGMEYARMELDDLENYERAAKITRRYVLDNHINDKDALLLLGDIYLDWATSLPIGAEKNDLFEEARLQYATLINLYGNNDLYNSRMLRYFIRTDNFREVLPLSTYFTTSKKITLEGEDLIELGGYLLDKQYGYLPPADEYLRNSIESLRDILQMGADADPNIPEGHYNLARYFVQTSNTAQAIFALKNAISTFNVAEKKYHARTLRHINSYRLLGELYTEQQEYLLSEQNYVDGIRLFEQAQSYTDLVANKDVGKLYSDMADLDYFISGDLQNALRNYQDAIEYFNDTPSIRYRVGFIQYNNGNYSEALGSFVKTASENPSNRNLLLALGNVLSIRNDDSAAYGYYDRLVDILDADIERYKIIFPQVREDHKELIELYLKSSNNLGVTLARLAERSGDSTLQASAIVQFSESIRAWDALTRNQDTMVRLGGSNLAEQNISYITRPRSTFEPAIYAEIPRILYGERMLEQSALN